MTATNITCRKFLYIGAITLLVAGIANLFLQSSALTITLSVLAIGTFSAFIPYDLKRVQDGHAINDISGTAGAYLSIDNVFQSRLALLGIARLPRRMRPRSSTRPDR